MSFYNKFEYYFLFTSEIIDCYDELVSLSMFDEDSVDKFFILIDKLYELREKEFEHYNEVTLVDLVNYLKYLSTKSINFLDLREIRIRTRIGSIYDRIRNYTINSQLLFPDINMDVELGVIDLINSKIIIDTYKLINKKFNSLFCFDAISNFYVDKLARLNIQSGILKLSVHETSELLALDALFDIDSITLIDLKQIDEILLKKYGKKLDIFKDIGFKIYDDIIDLFYKLENNKLDPNNVDSIYTNLFFVSYLEILLDYLNKEQLLKISLYFNNINIDNNLISDNVNRLIKNSIKKFYNN